MTYRHTRLAAHLGMATQAVAINLPALLFVVFHDELGASTAALGTLVAATFGVQMAVDALGARFVDRIGYRAAALASELLSAAGLLLLPALPALFPSRPFPAVAAALLVAAFGSGLQEVIVSPIVEALPSDRKAADMAALHASYCWGYVATVVLSTAWFALFGLASWRWLPVAWAALPLAGAALFGLLALGGDVGYALGPAVVGWVSDAAARLFSASPGAARAAAALFGEAAALPLGLKAALLAALLFPLAMLLLVRRAVSRAG